MKFFYLLLLKYVFSLNFSIIFAGNVIPLDYIHERNSLIKQEDQYAFGGQINLVGDEIPANDCLMHFKKAEVDDAFKNPTKFLPSRNFLEVQRQIEASPVFQIIKKAPKGGVFHAHSSAMTSASYIIKHMTYEPNLYICLDSKPMKFYFFKEPDQSCKWILLSELRKTDKEIDSKIERALVLPYSQDRDANKVWHGFEDIFDTIKGIISYKPLFVKHLIRAMEECYLDNVIFMEIRSPLSTIYDLEGTIYDQLSVAHLYKEISNDYMKTHPTFLGIKIIYAANKGVTSKALAQKIAIYKRVKAKLPDLIIGFDLVGQEDKLPTLLSHICQLRALGREGTPFFFHAGETNWYGQSTDGNLYDAVLLNTKRIGHGFALPKHPKLMEMIKQRKIAIEVNPISNQVLHLVNDMRNHPASIFFAENMPVVVSNDDPGFWDIEGLSYDFYEAFVGIMSRDADLRALKQLALNSIEYSGLTKMEIVQSKKIFDVQWAEFTHDLINSELCATK